MERLIYLLNALMPMVIVTILVTWTLRGIGLFRKHIMGIRPSRSKHIPRLMRLKFCLFRIVLASFNMNSFEEGLFFRWYRYCQELFYQRFKAEFFQMKEERRKEFLVKGVRMTKGAWRAYRKDRPK